MATFSLTILLYIDRICISAAKKPITESLDLTDKQFGWVLSAFAIGYALFQTPSGRILDAKGPRIVITAIVTIWSALTALTGFAWSFISLLIIRFLFGAGEAGAFPGISKSTFTWIPLKERGLVTGINFSGSRLGAAFAMPLVVILFETFGWSQSFILLGAVGVIWAIIWYYWFRDYPEQKSNISLKELTYIQSHRQQVSIEKGEPLKFNNLLKENQVILNMIQYFGSNYIFFFCLTWLFPYLKSKYQVSDIELSFWAMAPFIAGAFGNYFSGILVDSLYKKKNIQVSRRLPAIIGFSLVAIGLMATIFASNLYSSIIFISISIFGADMTLSPSWSYCIDIGHEQSGIVSGMMNMAGNVGSFITALAFPYLLDWTGTENSFFIIGILLSLVSIYCWAKMDPDKILVAS